MLSFSLQRKKGKIIVHSTGFAQSLKLRLLHWYAYVHEYFAYRKSFSSIMCLDYKMNTRRSSDAGFTLVEMMVAVSIFLIVMVVGVGSLIVMLSAANSAQAIQSISSNLSFAVDSISRDIRTGYTYHCTDDLAGPDDLLEPRDCLNGGSVLVFTDGETGDRTAYQFNQTSHRIEHPIFIESVSQPIWIAITSEDVYIENLRFFVEGSDDSDDVQPRVRVLVEGRAADQDIDAGTYFIQTTVTSKTLDL